MGKSDYWCHMMGAKHPEADKVQSQAYPWDVDDFRRCYKLLKLIPEWEEEMLSNSQCSLRLCCNVWTKLVDCWPELTRLYEAEDYYHLDQLLRLTIDRYEAEDY